MKLKSIRLLAFHGPVRLSRLIACTHTVSIMVGEYVVPVCIGIKSLMISKQGKFTDRQRFMKISKHLIDATHTCTYNIYRLHIMCVYMNKLVTITLR